MQCFGTQPIHDGLRRVQRFLRGLERGDVSSALSRRNGDGLPREKTFSAVYIRSEKLANV